MFSPGKTLESRVGIKNEGERYKGKGCGWAEPRRNANTSSTVGVVLDVGDTLVAQGNELPVCILVGAGGVCTGDIKIVL